MASLAIIGGSAPSELKSALISRGFELFELESEPSLPLPIASHADTLLFVLGRQVFLSSEYLSRVPALPSALRERGYSAVACAKALGNTYPKDIAYNVATVGSSAFGRFDFVADEIKEALSAHQYSLINVRQGYAKCSTLTLDSRSLITADTGIANAAIARGLEVLHIKSSAQDITLKGYGQGFIGGASGVCGDTVFFCGDICKHSDYEAIKSFCKTKGKKLCSLTDSPLCDVGGIIFL